MSQSSYGLAARQQMSVSPRLQQAVRLLQMSAIEFQQEFQQELSSNPFLEETEQGEAATPIELAVSGDLAPSGTPPDEGGSPGPIETAPDSFGEIRQEGEAFETAFESSPDAEAITLAESADWAALPEAGFETPSRSNSDGGELDPYSWVSAETSLREHLHQQVCGERFSERERLAAYVVIEALEDDGYLRDGLEETAAALDLEDPLTEIELRAGIAIVQQFEPIGVAARDLGECLALQLKAMPAQTPGRALALKVVAGQLEVLARRDYAALQRRLDCSEPALIQAHGLIRRLDPKPGQKFAAARTDYVVPDVIVMPVRGKLTAVINPAVMPRARLNRGCIDMLRLSRDGKYPAMQRQLQEARWLLRNVEQRYVTIKRVAEAIVARQRAFFQYGEIALKPLMLKEIADELGLHESTLSRATGNKYMATPRGTFEFKHFFSRQLSTDTGGTCSATAVRALIKEMIETESRDQPLSDVSLAKMLTAHGICVARRTVAKYRNQMKMPPAELRYLP